ncbi:hypothetical protein [Massilia glaciei]|uniref:hypothetical protein n=1 Tax=Massilia glaciei TaxID=1524097 RepID=UPI001E386B9D|nr:hypothetical protein [Massilia glaciei]
MHNAGRAIGAVARFMVIFDDLEELGIVALALAWRPFEPIVEATGRHAQYLSFTPSSEDADPPWPERLEHFKTQSFQPYPTREQFTS